MAQYKLAFEELGTVCLADGHARCGAVEAILNEKYGKGPWPEADPAVYFSSLYLSADQIKVKAYHKLIRSAAFIREEELICKLSRSFEIIRSGSNAVISPGKPHHFGMFVNQTWYELIAKELILTGASFEEQLDGNVFRQHIVPLFDGPGSGGAEMSHIGGEGAEDALMKQVLAEPSAVGFTLPAPSVNQVIAAAYTDSVLPHKTTFIEPKIPFGLLMYHLNPASL